MLPRSLILKQNPYIQILQGLWLVQAERWPKKAEKTPVDVGRDFNGDPGI